jgi:DNA repair exonuclease SbcCD ATPase subunit
MSALKRLTIAHLRGSVLPFSLPFEKGKKLAVIYGENGTGKSTICDAFEFLTWGKVSSLENRGLGSTLRFWPSLGKTASDVSVSLETSDGACQATMTRSGEVIVLPPDKRPRAEVFRKSQILSLIEATPGERYAAIRRFIDVSGVEASEATLRDLIRDRVSGE